MTALKLHVYISTGVPFFVCIQYKIKALYDKRILMYTIFRSLSDLGYLTYYN